MNIKQFAYYTLGSGYSKTKRDEGSRHLSRHEHQRFHGKRVRDMREDNDRAEKRSIGDIVYATINDQVVSWVNAYGGGAAATPTFSPASPAAPEYTQQSDQRVDGSEPASSTGSAPNKSQPAPPMSAGAANWGRQGYYNSETKEQVGLAFLNNKGGESCSGTFDYSFGNSLSYASSDGASCASSPQSFSGSLGDAVEIVVMTDKPCQGNECGFTRPNGVAHHGFDGASKMFLLEFDMPVTGNTGFNEDMPAVWILNAEIANVMQFANPGTCSCWESGCGEWDIFEVLDAGNKKCKSTWHGLKAYGDSNWFERPVSGTKKAAVVMEGDSGTGTIVYLPGDYQFDEVVDVATSNGYTEQADRVIQAILPN